MDFDQKIKLLLLILNLFFLNTFVCSENVTVSSTTKKFLPTALASTPSSVPQTSFVPTISTSTTDEVESTTSSGQSSSTTPSSTPTGSSSTSMPKKVVPYGSWSSPITSDVVYVKQRKMLEPPTVDRVTGNVFWVEEVAEEEGHGVVFQYNPGTSEIRRWTDRSANVRTRVHKYGGGSILVYGDKLYYSDATNNQIYLKDGIDGTPVKITNSPNKRFADGSYSPQTNKLYYVCEDHTPTVEGTGKEAKNSIVVIDLNSNSTEKELVAHSDFYASPRVTEDGQSIVWLQWNHPHMPWDKTEIYVAKLDANDSVAYEKYLQSDSMIMPSFTQNRELLYVHEMTGWWNLYIINKNGAEVNLTPQNRESGWPLWYLGTQSYAYNPAVGAHEVVVISGKELLVVDTNTAKSRVLDTGYDSFYKGLSYSNDGKKVYTIAADSKRFRRMVEIDVSTGKTKSLHSDVKTPVSEDYISSPSSVNYRTSDDMFAYGHYYAPKNPEFEAPKDTAPPLVVRCHGGPTSAATTDLALSYQFFTSRGIAILDVDYRGSTGYGRYYRNLLRHKWGVYDLADMVAGAKNMIAEGRADPNLLFVDGGSAGGYAALSALAFADIFTAGASIYGISNLTALMEDTHKFESQYIFSLIGNYPADKDRFFDRSPINFMENVTAPVVFFHGTEDAVVPINQAQEFYNLIKKKGLPTALVVYEGEHHGFTKLANKKDFIEKELIFFGKIGNFTVPDIPNDIVIDNFP